MAHTPASMPKINGILLIALRAPLFLKYLASSKEPMKSVTHAPGSLLQPLRSLTFVKNPNLSCVFMIVSLLLPRCTHHPGGGGQGGSLCSSRVT